MIFERDTPSTHFVVTVTIKEVTRRTPRTAVGDGDPRREIEDILTLSMHGASVPTAVQRAIDHLGHYLEEDA